MEGQNILVSIALKLLFQSTHWNICSLLIYFDMWVIYDVKFIISLGEQPSSHGIGYKRVFLTWRKNIEISNILF